MLKQQKVSLIVQEQHHVVQIANINVMLNILKQDPGATSQAAVDRKREQRDKEIANIKTFAAAVESAKDQLEYTYLKAPYDGNVVKKYVENFEDVQAKEPIVRILDDSSIEMVVSIPESLISLAPYVEDIKVVFDPFPGTKISAHIKEIWHRSFVYDANLPSYSGNATTGRL